MKIKLLGFVLLVAFLHWGCEKTNSDNHEDAEDIVEASSAPQRIVSLSGTLSEILVELGKEAEIVGVDMTTTYPKSLQELPRLGHSRNLSAEGVISLTPDLVLGFKDELNPAVKDQLESAGTHLVLLDREMSSTGLLTLVGEVATVAGAEKEGKDLVQRLKTELALVEQLSEPQSLLFIYARGAGTLMVGGKNTAADAMIGLIGGTNAASSFEDFKPLTAEALVAANPACLFMFDSGLESLGGIEGLLEVPGVTETDAGRNQRVVTMDGQLLLGFGPRLPLALKTFKDLLEPGPVAYK